MFYRHYFHNTREIFSITVAGQKIYIVTSPKDISTVYKNFQTLTFDGFVKDMYSLFGMSPTGIAKMFEPITPRNSMTTDLSSQQHAHLGTGIQREQLHPGQNLDNVIATYLSHIEQQMNWDNIPNSCIVEASTEKKVVSLRNWCADVLDLATVQAFFGMTLLELNPDLLDDFHIFDFNSWMLLYQYPRMFAKPMYESMERGTRAFTRYFELPVEKRSEACHYIRMVEAKQRSAGMTDRDIAIAGHMFFWA